MKNGVSPVICVVKAPNQGEFVDVESVARPETLNVTVVPLGDGAKINGEPANTEHAGSFGLVVFEQTVLDEPGPTAVRLKATPGKLINPRF